MAGKTKRFQSVFMRMARLPFGRGETFYYVDISKPMPLMLA